MKLWKFRSNCLVSHTLLCFTTWARSLTIMKRRHLCEPNNSEWIDWYCCKIHHSKMTNFGDEVANLYVNVFICIYVCVYMCLVCISVFVHVYINTCIHTHTYIYITYIYIYIYIFIYIVLYMYMYILYTVCIINYMLYMYIYSTFDLCNGSHGIKVLKIKRTLYYT